MYADDNNCGCKTTRDCTLVAYNTVNIYRAIKKATYEISLYQSGYCTGMKWTEYNLGHQGCWKLVAVFIV